MPRTGRNDFESYTLGQGLLTEANWATWGDDPGADCVVTDAAALSGTQSIIIQSGSDTTALAARREFGPPGR